MKKIAVVTIAIITLTIAFATPAQASTESHIRILNHFTEEVGPESGWMMAGWLVLPDPGETPEKFLVVAGPRYQSEDWNLEAMVGAIINSGEATPLLDLRAGYNRHRPLTLWGMLQWIDPSAGNDQSVYVYGEANYWLIPKRFALGLETENTFKGDGEEILSVGPHLVMPVGKATFVAAYQFHEAGQSQFWMRVVINF